MGVGVSLNLVGAVFNQGSTFAVNLVVANLLGRQAFGEYTMVLGTVATLALLGQLSMGYTATRHLAEFRTVDPARASRILGLCGLISAIAALVVSLGLALPADWLASRVLNAPHLAGALRLAAAAVFFLVLIGFLTGSLAGLEAYPSIARAGVASGVLYFVSCVLLARRYGLSGAVLGVAISATVQAAILSVLLVRTAGRHGIALTRHGLWRERQVISGFAVPASLTGFLSLPAAWIANALLARQPGGYDQLALFGAANNFRTMVLFLPHTINNVGMSLLNNQQRTSDRGFRRVFWMNLGMTGVATVAAAGIILLAASPLLALFGRSFVEGRAVLAVLMIPAVLEGVSLAVYQIVVSRSRMWASLFLVALPRDVTTVVSAAFLAPALGAVGLALSYGGGWTLAVIGILAIVGRLGIRPSQEPTGAPGR
jgi:O-antigen/teichoic acid export membrane protein